MTRIGLFGGTFDPVHLGHLAAAEGVRHMLELDRVLFMPNRIPPHKAGRSITPALHRAAMVRIAIAGNPHFGLLELELNREGPSYTAQTLRIFRQEYPDLQPILLIGMDSLLEIETWREYPTVLTQTDTVVFSRPGYPIAQCDAILASLGPEMTARLQVVEVPGVDIAATLLRELAGSGYPLRYLVPDGVANYIKENRLYQ